MKSLIKQLQGKDKSLVTATSSLSSQVSILEKLIDNSIDAGANIISIELDSKTCGLKHIKVTDNGMGIPSINWDLLGLVDHISSKSSSNLLFEGKGSNLFNICQLVSGSIKFTSKGKQDPFGKSWYVKSNVIEGINLKSLFQFNSGTEITLDSLFGVYPVRYNFLSKRTKQSTTLIRNLILCYALSFRDIKFILRFKASTDSTVYPSNLNQSEILKICFPNLSKIKAKFKQKSNIQLNEQISLSFLVCEDQILLSSIGGNVSKILLINGKSIHTHNELYAKIKNEVETLIQSILQFKPIVWNLVLSGIPKSEFDSKLNLEYIRLNDNEFEKWLISQIKYWVKVIVRDEEELLNVSHSTMEISDYIENDVSIFSLNDEEVDLTKDSSISESFMLDGKLDLEVEQGSELKENVQQLEIFEESGCKSSEKVQEILNVQENDSNDWSFSMLDCDFDLEKVEEVKDNVAEDSQIVAKEFPKIQPAIIYDRTTSVTRRLSIPTKRKDPSIEMSDVKQKRLDHFYETIKIDKFKSARIENVKRMIDPSTSFHSNNLFWQDIEEWTKRRGNPSEYILEGLQSTLIKHDLPYEIQQCIEIQFK
ncbi:hypothetical protein DFJ63DRAFT_314867 [Scheffersomyces coipomensis]|uniref:uncharacterized protein n=1 Tax=Scheffersomyces coipomensis TaxID=1788519 RepID=UPI00315D75E6